MNQRTVRIQHWLISYCFIVAMLPFPISVLAQTFPEAAPLVIAGSMDDRPRTLFVTQDRYTWITYDTDLGNLHRIWIGGLEAPSLKSTSFLAGNPTVQGIVLFENQKEQRWRIIRKGEVLIPEVSFLGYRWMGNQLILQYSLQTSYGHSITVEERPRISQDREFPVFHRSFSVSNVPSDVQVGLEVAAEKIRRTSDVNIEGIFHRYGEKQHSYYWGTAVDIHGRLMLDADTTTSFSVTFSPGIISGTEDNSVSEASPVPMLRTIRAVESDGLQPVLRRRSDHEVGIALKVYGIGEPIERLAELAPGQLPNVNQVINQIDLTQKDQFGGLDFYFITQLSGYLNIAAPGEFLFRVLADDGIRLSVSDSILIEKDELQAAQPSKDVAITLPAGVHPIEIEHFQSTGRKQLTVMWQPPWKTEFEILQSPVLSTRKEEQRFASTSRKYVKRPFASDSLQIGRIEVESEHPSLLAERIHVPGLEGYIGGLDVLSSGRLVAATYAGDGKVVILDGDIDTPTLVNVKQIASGLNMPLGLEVVDDEIFVLQQHELTQLIDNDGNELIDEYRVVSNDWEVSTDYTELASGLEYSQGHFLSVLGMPLDRDGAILIEDIHHRGVLVRTGFDGSQQVIGAGMQLSGGLTLEQDLIAISDQRNPWFSDSRIVFLPTSVERSLQGDEAGYVELSSIWLPIEPSQNPSQPFYLPIGPYEGDWVVGDMINQEIYRLAIDKVNQQVQGAVFPFSADMPANLNRIVALSDSVFLAGGASLEQPWGGLVEKSTSLYRLKINNEDAFEMKAIRIVDGGFEVEFTQPIDEDKVSGQDMLSLYQWPNSETRRDRTRKRGGREMLQVRSAELLEGGKTLRVAVDGLKAGHLVYFNVSPDLTGADGETLWSNEAWYSINALPVTTSDAP